MFVKAIEKNKEWTYPITLGIKNTKNKDVDLFVATLIKINNDGCFLTCAHVADAIIDHFNNPENSHLILPIKLSNDTKVDIIKHNFLDMAIIKFNDTTLKGDCPTFSTDSPLPGLSICKLGFAFTNGNPFTYDKKNKNIIISENNQFETPLFPYEGMVTRIINFNIDGNIISNAAFETSTPGLNGQSGGPIFDKDGTIYGMQSLNINMPLNIENNKNKEQYMSFGIGISSQKIISFLNDNNIKYN